MEVIKDIVEALDKGLKAGAYDYQEAARYIGAIQFIEREMIEAGKEIQKLREAQQTGDAKLTKK